MNIDPVISKGLMISDCECSVANGTATSTAQQGSGKRSRGKITRACGMEGGKEKAVLWRAHDCSTHERSVAQFFTYYQVS